MAENELISTISTEELVPLLDADEHLFLVDVREPDEVADWQIPGAHNIPLNELEGRLGELPSGSSTAGGRGPGTARNREPGP